MQVAPVAPQQGYVNSPSPAPTWLPVYDQESVGIISMQVAPVAPQQGYVDVPGPALHLLRSTNLTGEKDTLLTNVWMKKKRIC